MVSKEYAIDISAIKGVAGVAGVPTLPVATAVQSETREETHETDLETGVITGKSFFSEDNLPFFYL